MGVVNQYLEVEGCSFLESRECRKCSVTVAELHGLPSIKESLAKSIERLGVQAEQHQQQQQTFLKYIKGMIKGKTTMEEVQEGSSSKIHSMVDVSQSMMMEGKYQEKCTKLEGEDFAGDRSIFKKIEIPDFVENDPESCFDGAALDWYRSHEKRKLFVNWEDLKRRLIVRFRSGREGSIMGRKDFLQATCKVKDQKELKVLVVQENGEELEVVEEEDSIMETEIQDLNRELRYRKLEEEDSTMET
ncbi:transposon Tf2-1 polyprotein isoform X1 [Cucumis melo var. makuwa]|uniref:Transposon Tf2-1 polyprotein isoform X1 n=1 Tax=Cucumis melo var. makuwa TaxID=1194695 RepID=A0A5D3CT36_CUCMM|nr:transposon Tf2-1 polyprotein isoform X1 [Cucumis melo var. makuwa]